LIRVCEECDHSDILLTAAHCVVELIWDPVNKRAMPTTELLPRGNMRVASGLHWTTRKIVPKGEVSEITHAVFHPDWNPQGPSELSHDIAIIQTDVPINFSESIRPIAIPRLSDPPVHSGVRCKVAGWGYTTEKVAKIAAQLQEIDAIITNSTECLEDYPETASFYDPELMTCVKSERGQSTTCQGDSGSALVCPGPIAVGLVSFGSDFCGDKEKTVFTTIQPYLKWIHDTALERSKIAEKDFLDRWLK